MWEENNLEKLPHWQNRHFYKIILSSKFKYYLIYFLIQILPNFGEEVVKSLLLLFQANILSDIHHSSTKELRNSP